MPGIRTKFVFALLACAAVAAPMVNAAPLGVGGTLYPAPAEPDPINRSVIDTMTMPFVTPTFTGTLTSEVIFDDMNPLGGLTFTFLVTNDIKSDHPVSRLTVNGYEGWLTDASWLAEERGGVVPPSLINRPTADFVGWTFFEGIGPGLIEPGTTSALLVIQTNAPSYTRNEASVIDGYVATVPTFAPAVPEPGTLGILALSGLAFVARRRRTR